MVRWYNFDYHKLDYNKKGDLVIPPGKELSFSENDTFSFKGTSYITKQFQYKYYAAAPSEIDKAAPRPGVLSVI